MAGRKQDWTTRTWALPSCDVTIEYSRMDDGPIERLKAEANPYFFMHDFGMDAEEAIQEASRVREMIRTYFAGRWWYVRIEAHTRIPSRQGPARIIRTDSDYFESHLGVKDILSIEAAELLVLKVKLEDLNVSCDRIRLNREGTHHLEHGVELRNR